VSGEESVHKTNLVRDEKSETETEQTGSQGQAARKFLSSFSNHRKCGGDAHRDQHHARNCAHTKYQQIGHGPADVADGCQYQQSHRG